MLISGICDAEVIPDFIWTLYFTSPLLSHSSNIICNVNYYLHVVDLNGRALSCVCRLFFPRKDIKCAVLCFCENVFLFANTYVNSYIKIFDKSNVKLKSVLINVELRLSKNNPENKWICNIVLVAVGVEGGALLSNCCCKSRKMFQSIVTSISYLEVILSTN